MIVFVEVLAYFGIISLLFGIIDGHLAHKVVAGILIFCLALVFHVKVFTDFVAWSLVDHIAISKQNQAIAIRVGFRAWLVNGAHDSFVLLPCIVLQDLADPHSRKAIKA